MARTLKLMAMLGNSSVGPNKAVTKQLQARVLVDTYGLPNFEEVNKDKISEEEDDVLEGLAMP